MCPAFPLLLKQLYSSAPWFAPLIATLALIPLAQRQNIVLVFATHMSRGFEAFVIAAKVEVERPLLDIIEIVVVLCDHPLKIAAVLLACFNQQVEALLASVVRDAFVTGGRMGDPQQPVRSIGQKCIGQSCNFAP